MFYRRFAKPLLFAMDPEKAHDLTMNWARRTEKSRFLQALARNLYDFRHPALKRTLMGLEFRNPVGIAAGFDKNGRIPKALQTIGFGYVEIGSITAKPSAGNPKPRMFRLPDDRGLVNRMGLNNDGAQVIMERLDKSGLEIPLGVNIAKTHDPHIEGDAAVRDYMTSLSAAETKADYIMVNISCPNTAEGKTFEQPGPLRDLLDGLMSVRRRPDVPLLVKFSPDVDEPSLHGLIDICEQYPVEGYALSNTSVNRGGLSTPSVELEKIGRGGLSGRPLKDRAEKQIARLRSWLGNDRVLVGIGGIDDPESAVERLHAGADLIQVYSGLIYEGPSLVGRINREIAKAGI